MTTHNEMPKDTVEELAQILQDMYFENGAVVDINSWNITKEILTTAYNKGVEVGREWNYDKLWGEGYAAGILYERNRIEEIFKKHVPPHAMDLEDSVWLKRLLNKAFNHVQNI